MKEIMNAPSNQTVQKRPDENTMKQTSKSYKLNVDKNLSKKLAATKRAENLNVEEKDGGTVITADAATFCKYTYVNTVVL